MATFCPSCSCLLVVDNCADRLACQTCPYQYKYTSKYFRKAEAHSTIAEKEARQQFLNSLDILGGKRAWDGVETTSAQCPSCNHDRAYFKMMQTRSADEPMTSFYKCQKCHHNWKEDG